MLHNGGICYEKLMLWEKVTKPQRKGNNKTIMSPVNLLIALIMIDILYALHH